jgi:peptide methionine sulfoxide reductase msrA/msrB
MKMTSLYILGLFLFLLGSARAETKKAYFAGGCFWCMESPFEKVEGVIEVYSGYAGGTEANPSYKQVAGGKTSHREAVEVVYDSKKISYKDLLFIFWQQIDPTDAKGQFVDKGFQYSSAIFYQNESEKKLAEESLKLLKETKVFSKSIVTPIIKHTSFYQAEDYHQNYYKENAIRYWYYRRGSGRDQFLEKKWSSEKKKLWKEKMKADVRIRK